MKKMLWLIIYFLLVSPAVILSADSKRLSEDDLLEVTTATPSQIPVSTTAPTATPNEALVEAPALDPAIVDTTPAKIEPVQTPKNIDNIFKENGPRIYMYHYIRSGVDRAKDGLGYNLSINPGEFEKQLQTLKDGGFHTVTVSDLVRGDSGSKSVALSFDDGYADFYTDAFPLLQKYGFTATVYVISGKDGGQYLTWDQIKEMSSKGIEIGSHTVGHKGLDKLGASDQHFEIFQSKADIEGRLGKPVYSFCYPSGKYNQDTEALVREAGYENAVTTKGGGYNSGADHFFIQRVRVSPQS